MVMVNRRSHGSRQGSLRPTSSLRINRDLSALDSTGAHWVELGPRPFYGINGVNCRTDQTMSGQVSAIAVDGDEIYIGSSSGGLWRGTTGSNVPVQFELISDQTLSPSVGCIAIAKTVPRTIYVGTGAPDNSANISSYGGGILISRDNGGTWTAVESADNDAHTFVGLGFSSILVDQVEPNVLLAATGFGTDPNCPHSSVPQGDDLAFGSLGIYRSDNAGNTWTQMVSADYSDSEFRTGLLAPGGFFHIDLLYASLFDTYFAGISKRGLFVSTDRGISWRDLRTLPGWGFGLPDPSEMYRISLAARDRFLWALVLRKPFPKDKESAFELFQSDDGGHFWTPQPLLVPAVPPPCTDDGGDPGPLPFKGGLMYVAAPPLDSNILLVATERLYRRDNFRDAASPWKDIEHNLHGDQHAIAFDHHGNWYVGDDGGGWVTSDRGDHWTSLNSDLRTLEFFSAAADSAESGSYAGGLQDNGPAVTGGDPAWAQLVFGDGAYVLADPREPGAFFMSEPRGAIFYARVSAPGDLKPVIALSNLNPVSDFLTPFEILPTVQRLYANRGFPGFNFEPSRIVLTGANNPWLVAFDPDAPGTNTVASSTTSRRSRAIPRPPTSPRVPLCTG
jgi:hypothetical protein